MSNSYRIIIREQERIIGNYNTKLKELLSKDINLNNSNESIINFIDNDLSSISSIFYTIEQINRSNRIKDNITFFIKSFLIYLLIKTIPITKIQSLINFNPSENPDLNLIKYPSNNDGLLSNMSGNCIFTIISFYNQPLFVKVVDYDNYLNKDCIIFDIINSFIFNLIIEKENYHNLDVYISKYKYSFLSYYEKKINNSYWNYKDLYYDPYNTSQINFNSPYCPYYPSQTILKSNINNIIETEITNSNYKRSFIYISEAIEEAISIDSLSRNYRKYKTLLKQFFLSSVEFYFKFLLKIAIDYGFNHNDLFFNNILYDIKNNKLVIIDLGRAIFGKFIFELDDNEDKEKINNYLSLEISKLNLDKHNYYKDYLASNLSYTDLCDYDVNLLYTRSYIDEFKLPSSEIHCYPYCVFDIICYCCNNYVFLLNFLHKEDISNNLYYFNVLLAEFNKLFMINNTIGLLSNQSNIFAFIDQLKNPNISYTLNNGNSSKEFALNSYKEIIENYLNRIDNTHPYYEYKSLLKYLLDGLLLTVLLFLNFNVTINNSSVRILHSCFQSLLELDDKKDFITNLSNFYFETSNKEIFDKYNHPLKFIFSNNSNIIDYYQLHTGGEKSSVIKKVTKVKSSIFKSSNIKSSTLNIKKPIDYEEYKLNNIYKTYKELFESNKEGFVEFIKRRTGGFKIKKQLKKY